MHEADSGIPESFKSFNPVKGQLQQVKQLIDEQLVCTDKSIQLLLSLICARPGKMIRPALVLLCAESCGKTLPIHVRIAAIIELIHTATLLHDDVVDDAKQRRWQPTVNNLYGNTSAVLLGDLLLSRIFSMCTDLHDRQISRLLADTTERICRGELRQNLQSSNFELTEPEYIEIISDKSAALFESACYLGALASQTTQKQLQFSADFGLNLGIAYQIKDDLIDIIGTEHETGKTLGRDIKKHKLTLPFIHLLNVANNGDKNLVIEKLTNKTYNLKQLVNILEKNSSLDYAHSRIKHFCGKAILAIKNLPPSPPRQALIETAGLVI